MPAKKLRVLLVETSPDDARHTLAKLKQGGYAVEHQRVDSAPAMQAALAKDAWDIVLCSHDPSGFCGPEALKLTQEAEIDLPFLFLSHDLREKTIIQAIQSGAGDYIFKDSLDRLIPAIEHGLREAGIQREHRAAQLALQENQIRLHAFIANLPGMAYQLLLDTRGAMSFPYISEGSHALLGLNPQDLEHDPLLFLDMLHPDDRTQYHQTMRTSAEKLSFWNWEGRVVMPPKGEIKWINLRCSPRKLANDDVQWEGIMSNISQSRLAEIGIKQSQEQLRELSSHIQDAREQERLNIAREIHDDMGGTLTAIKLDIAWLGNRLDAPNQKMTAKATELLAKAKGIEALVDRCISSANNISRTLRPSVLDSFGLIAAIEMEAEEFEKRTSISCVIQYQAEDAAENLDASIGPDISITLFRIFQETLTNIIKHAQATQAQVSISNRADHVDMTVSDNGRGTQEVDRLKPRSFGLRGIQERVAHFNGEVKISSTPGQGTTITVHIPHAPKQDSALPQQTLF